MTGVETMINMATVRQSVVRMRVIWEVFSPSILHTHRRVLKSFNMPFIEQRKGIGVIAVKNGLDNLLIFFNVSWWI